jgi:hypothetical protein
MREILWRERIQGQEYTVVVDLSLNQGMDRNFFLVLRASSLFRQILAPKSFSCEIYLKMQFFLSWRPKKKDIKS